MGVKVRDNYQKWFCHDDSSTRLFFWRTPLHSIGSTTEEHQFNNKATRDWKPVRLKSRKNSLTKAQRATSPQLSHFILSNPQTTWSNPSETKGKDYACVLRWISHKDEVFLGPFPGWSWADIRTSSVMEVVGMWPKGWRKTDFIMPKIWRKTVFRLKTLTQEVVCIYKAPVCVPESICGGE